MMTEFFVLLLSTILVNNFVLVKFLGLCPFMGVSNKLDTAIGMCLATTFVLTLASLCSYLVEFYILAPLELSYLRTLSFILVIAVVVQFTEMVVHKTSPALYRLLGIFLPLITTNCAVFGVCVLNIDKEYGFMQTLVASFAYAAGFGLALILFAGLRERILLARVPSPLQDTSIALVTAGIVSLSFYAFKGMV